jgi:probable HAF family extracellular repeat protein
MPLALNDGGQVVGFSKAADGSMRAFFWDSTGMHELASDFLGSEAQTITNSGTIAGVGIREGGYHVLVWTNGVVRNLGQVHGPDGGSRVVAVTGAGDVVAWAQDLRSWSVFWQGGVKQELGGLESLSPHARASAMNFNRQIVGSSFMHAMGDNDVNHAFIWEDGVMRDLGVLVDYACPDRPERRCGYAEAVDINNQGAIVGLSRDTAGQQHAVLWANGSIRDLGLGQAVAINSSGDVIAFTDRKAFFWRDGATVVLDSLAGGITRAVDINDQGLIAGYSMASGGKPHVVVWHAGQAALTDLGIGPPGVQGDGAVAVAMNARGDIIGYAAQFACSVGCATRAILWRVKQ